MSEYICNKKKIIPTESSVIGSISNLCSNAEEHLVAHFAAYKHDVTLIKDEAHATQVATLKQIERIKEEYLLKSKEIADDSKATAKQTQEETRAIMQELDNSLAEVIADAETTLNQSLLNTEAEAVANMVEVKDECLTQMQTLPMFKGTYSEGTAYSVGDVVVSLDGNRWQSNENNNTGQLNEPSWSKLKSDIPVYKTTHDIAIAYKSLSKVEDSGNIYQAVIDVPPNTPLSNKTYWTVVKEADAVDLSYTAKMMDAQTTHVSGKGNPQGLAIVDGFLYIHENVKDSSAGIPTGHCEEKGIIKKYPMHTDRSSHSALVTTVPLDGLAHQCLGYYKEDNQLYLFSQGGMPCDSTTPSIVCGNETLNPNWGRSIKVVKWDDSTTPVVTDHKLIPDYSSSDDDTRWFYGYPCLDNETNVLAVLYKNLAEYNHKKVAFYHLSDVLSEGYPTPIKEFEFNTTDYLGWSNLPTQGFAYRDNMYYMSVGRGNATEKKAILKWRDDGTFVRKYEYAGDPTTNEPEGLCFAEVNGKVDMYSLMFLSTSSNVLKHGTGRLSRFSRNIPYSAVHSSAKWDVSINQGNTFTVGEWDGTCMSHLYSVTHGNMRMRGRGIVFGYGGSHEVRALEQIVSDDRDYLSIGYGAVADRVGGELHVYGKDDPSYPNSVMAFGRNFSVQNSDEGDIFYVSNTSLKVFKEDPADATNSIEYFSATPNNLVSMARYLFLNTVDKVIAALGNETRFRAGGDGTLSAGAGITLYGKDHPTKPYSTKIYTDHTNGGYLLLSGIPTSNPNISQAVYSKRDANGDHVLYLSR